jgi:hypothetical protein
LDVSTDGKKLIVTPATPSARRKKLDVAQELAHKRYEKAFQKLTRKISPITSSPPHRKA